MTSPQKKLRRDTRVFISAVSRELGSVRKLAKKGLEDNDYHAVEQENFPPDYRQLMDKLRERIESCDAVLHIAGHCYGAEPQQRPDGAPRRSYTQMEYDLAVELGKPVYVFLTGDGFPTDPHEPEDDAQTRLQSEHRQRLTATGQDYNPTATREELDQKIRSLQLKVEALQQELTHVDQHVTRTGRKLGSGIAVAVAVGLLILGISLFVQHEQRQGLARQERERIVQQQERDKQDREREQQETERRKQDEERLAAEAARQQAQKIDQIEQEFADRFLHQLLANKEITAEDARQRALKELPALVKLPVEEIQAIIDRKIPAATPEAPVSPLDRARTALAQGKLDDVLKAADEQRQEGRELAMLEGTAALAKFRESPKLEWNERALAAFRRALALSNRTKEPKAWTDAAIAAASLLDDLALYSEAEPLLIDALAILEKEHGNESREVAVVLNNLALLLRGTNRLAEAEPLMRRALALDEQAYGAEHPNVAANLNNLAQLLKATNRPTEAEPLMRRALAIDEQSYGPEHSDVARDVNNLAQLLEATNRLAEAEPLMRRALASDEQSYGAEHPNVAIRLNNLAALLQATNRLAEAEPLMRHSLAIFEQSYGAGHPNVATGLNNLAQLLQDTNRLAEAEPLMRRMVMIFHRFGVNTGHRHPNTQAALANYRDLLLAMRLPDDEISQRVKDATAIAERLKPIVPEVDRLLGPAKSVADVLAALDRQYKADGKPAVYFLTPKEPIAPHLDELLGKSEIDLPLNQPIAPQLDKLLGPAKSTKEVFEELDRQYREQKKPRVWFLPLSEPIAPHLDELLGPPK